MSKEMKNIEKFTDKEWEELASILSEEKNGHADLINRFSVGDTGKSAKQWKELKNMSTNEEINVDEAWNKVHSRLVRNSLIPEEPTAKLRFMRTTIMRIAAVALILISLGTVGIYINNAGYFSKKISVIAGNDQKNVLVSLPDGSKIYLNRNSEFTYMSNFGKHRRNVSLTGEAFFEIAPDPTKPFIIDAGKADVKVVGTSFNVITNNSESSVEVFVKTGKVIVSDESGSKSVQLDPGYVGTMNSERSDKKLNDNPNYISWKTGYLDYDNQKLSVVFSDLNRVYNMNIVADDVSILENRWSSPIVNLQEETIIQVICNTFNLSYAKDGDVFHLSKK